MVDSQAAFDQRLHINTDVIQWPKAFNQVSSSDFHNMQHHFFPKDLKDEQMNILNG